MAKKRELERLTYTETSKLVFKILDEQSSMIKSVDSRERLIQKVLERIQAELGHKVSKEEVVELRGTVEALIAMLEERRRVEEKIKEDWKWKLGFILGILGFLATVVFKLLEYLMI